MERIENVRQGEEQGKSKRERRFSTRTIWQRLWRLLDLYPQLSRALSRGGEERGGEDGGKEEAKGGGGERVMECTTGFRRNDARSCAGENVMREERKREGLLADREHLLMRDERRPANRLGSAGEDAGWMRAGKAEWVGGESEGRCFRLFLGGLPRERGREEPI